MYRWFKLRLNNSEGLFIYLFFSALKECSEATCVFGLQQCICLKRYIENSSSVSVFLPGVCAVTANFVKCFSQSSVSGYFLKWHQIFQGFRLKHKITCEVCVSKFGIPKCINQSKKTQKSHWSNMAKGSNMVQGLTSWWWKWKFLSSLREAEILLVSHENKSLFHPIYSLL